MTNTSIERDRLDVEARPAEVQSRDEHQPASETASPANARQAPVDAAVAGEPTLRDFVREAAAAKAAAQAASTPQDFMRQSAVAAALSKAAATAGEQPAVARTGAVPSVAEGGTPVEGSALSAEELDELKQAIVMALKSVYDPEIPSDIYELGLIYRIDVDDSRNVEIDMTLTAPGCPVAGEMPIWVENAVGATPGVGGVKVNLVFDPPWDQSRMSDEAKLAVGMF